MEIVKEGYDAGRGQRTCRPKQRGISSWVTCGYKFAVLFGEVNGTFSDAAYKISKRAKPVLFKEGWQKIFEMADIREQVRDITKK